MLIGPISVDKSGADGVFWTLTQAAPKQVPIKDSEGDFLRKVQDSERLLVSQIDCVN